MYKKVFKKGRCKTNIKRFVSNGLFLCKIKLWIQKIEIYLFNRLNYGNINGKIWNNKIFFEVSAMNILVLNGSPKGERSNT